jgi:hypothetical protein
MPGVCPGKVFVTFGGPQGHGDRLLTCGGLAVRLSRVIAQSCASDGLGAVQADQVNGIAFRPILSRDQRLERSCRRQNFFNFNLKPSCD